MFIIVQVLTFIIQLGMLSCCVMHEMHVGFWFWFVSLSLQCMVLFCHNEEISSHLLNLFHYFLKYTLHSNAKNSFQNFLRKCLGLSVDHTFDPTRWEFLSVRVKPAKLAVWCQTASRALCRQRELALPSQLAGASQWHPDQANVLSLAGNVACLVKRHGFGITVCCSSVGGCKMRTSAEWA